MPEDAIFSDPRSREMIKKVSMHAHWQQVLAIVHAQAQVPFVECQSCTMSY